MQKWHYLVSGLCWSVGLLMLFWQAGRNLWVGVRLPWTLADAALWKKSWRLASRLLMVMGVTVIFSWRAFFISTVHLIGLTCLYTALRYRLKYGTWRYWKEPGWIDYRPVVRCNHCGHFQKLQDEGELPLCTCEACGRSCRSRPREGALGSSQPEEISKETL
ncbi:MAG: SdpI family protein [Desulfobaccales bacterium]